MSMTKDYIAALQDKAASGDAEAIQTRLKRDYGKRKMIIANMPGLIQL